MWRSLDLEMAIVRCKSQSTKDLTSAEGCWWCRLPSGSVNRFARQTILGSKAQVLKILDFRRDINAKIGRNLKMSPLHKEFKDIPDDKISPGSKSQL